MHETVEKLGLGDSEMSGLCHLYSKVRWLASQWSITEVESDQNLRSEKQVKRERERKKKRGFTRPYQTKPPQGSFLNINTQKKIIRSSYFDKFCDPSSISVYKMQQISLNERVENSLLDVPVTFVRCEAQQNVHVFIPEAFDLHLITTIAENFRYQYLDFYNNDLTLISIVARSNSLFEYTMTRSFGNLDYVHFPKDPLVTLPHTACSSFYAVIAIPENRLVE